MKNFLLLFLVAVLAFSAPVQAVNQADYFAGQLVIKLSENYSVSDMERYIWNTGNSELDDVFNRVDASHFYRMFPHALPPVGGGVDLSQIFILKYLADDSVVDLAEEISALSGVEYAEPRYKYQLLMDYNDHYIDDEGQYGMRLIHASEAHDIYTGDPSSLIAVVDTGIDMDHEDLEGNVWQNLGEDIDNDGRITEDDANGEDDDENGSEDDFWGWDFVGDDNFPDDVAEDGGHGTHCAGIVSAETNNQSGVASIGYNCNLIIVRVGTGRVIDFGFEGVEYAVRAGASVISLSWGGYQRSQAAEDVIDYALDNDALVLAAAGNDDDVEIMYPAGYANTMAVAATDQDDHKSDFSNYGDWVDISAPGTRILSSYLDNRYAYMNGTSMATPMVAGLAGLMRAYNPDLSAIEVWDIITDTADDIYEINEDYQGELGAGRINALAAMEAAEPDRPEMDVNPRMVEIELEQNTIGEAVFEILNAGDGDLEYDLETIPEQIPWLEVQPDAGVVGPDQAAEITLTVDANGLGAGDYHASVNVLSNDPDLPMVLVIVDVVVTEPQFVPELQHFTNWRRTNLNHSFLVIDLAFEGEVVPTGWEVGLFTPAGLLAGGEVWVNGERMGFAAWGDEPETEAVEGFVAGEAITFRAWDFESDVEYRIAVETLEGPVLWTNNGFSVVTLEALSVVELTVELERGWNIMSINVAPDREFYDNGEDGGPDVPRMLAQLAHENGHHVTLFKNISGQFYSPAFDFNNIPYWNLTQGYQISVDENTQLQYTGEPIPVDSDIQLRVGWNMIAYFPEYELDAGAPDFPVLSPIIDRVDIAKNERGEFLSPEFDFSNMPPWQPTQGYQVKISGEEGLVFNYPEQGDALAGISRNQSDNSEVLYSENMSVLVVLDGRADSGDELIAVDNHGNVVGRGAIMQDGRCGLAVWGDDPITEAVEGLQTGEAFALKVQSQSSGNLSDLNLSGILHGNGLLYKTDGFTVIKAISNDLVPETTSLAEAYPNPFNGVTQIRFDLAEAGDVALTVVDLSGRTIAELGNGWREAGAHTVSWQPEHVASGIYYIQLRSGVMELRRKVCLLK